MRDTTGKSSQAKGRVGLPFTRFELYPLAIHVLSFSIESLNIHLRRPHIGNINIARCAKGVPDHPAPVVYPFITVLSVRTGGGGA